MQRVSRLSMLAIFVFALAACSSGPAAPPPDSCSTVPPAALYAGAYLADPHYCMFTFASGLTGARQLALAPNGDLFVAGNGQITVLFDTNGDGVSDASERAVVRDRAQPATTASPSPRHTSTRRRRRPSTAGPTRPAIASRPARWRSVVKGIPAGGHATRTLVVDAQNRLYVSIGSASNVDAPATDRAARDARADPPLQPGVGPRRRLRGRRRRGVRLRPAQRGRPQHRQQGPPVGRRERPRQPDAGGDIHYDNPAEEVNLFDVEQARPQLRIPVLLERRHLDGHGDGEGPWDAAPGSRSARLVHRGEVPGRERRRAARVRAGRAPGAARHRRVPRRRLPGRHAGRPVRRVARLVEPRDRPGRPRDHPSEDGRERPDRGARTSWATRSPRRASSRRATWAIRPVSIRVDKAGLLTFSDDTSGTVNKIGYKP